MNNFSFRSPSSAHRVACNALRPLILLLALLCANATTVRAQGAHEKSTLATPDETATKTEAALPALPMPKVSQVPMIVRSGHAFVKAQVNGKPATFLLDTGANGHLITPQAAERLGLTIDDKLRATVAGASGKATGVQVTRLDSLKIGAFDYRNQLTVVHELPGSLRCDGLLGAPFIGAQVTTLDYERRTLTLTDHAAFVAPAQAAILPIRNDNGLPLIELGLGDRREMFLLDTGDNRSITLHTPFVEQNKLRELYAPIFTTATGWSIGGTTRGDLARLPTLKFGEIEMRGVVGELSRQTQGYDATDGVKGGIGGEILRRFVVSFDYKHARVLFQPNASFDEPFDVPRSGMVIDERIVTDVAPNAPAQEAGVKVGDEIVEVNGKPAVELAAWRIYKMFQQSAGTQVRLKLRSPDGVEREVVVILRDLI